jgi:copper chaperone
MVVLCVPDMSCGHCKATVEGAIRSVDPGAQVAVDLATRQVRIASGAPVEALLVALEMDGYRAVEALAA